MARTVREIVQGLARGIAATVAGVLVAGLTIAGIEWLGQRLYPPPAVLKADDLEALAAYVTALPIGALLFVLLAWLLGVFLGGLIAALLAGRRPRLYTGVIAAVILFGAIANFAMIPHPAWFMALTVLTLPLAGFAAAAIGARRGTEPTASAR
jgi:pimeloyl-ACP methyl ester carboxylesterase